ncbi:MAG TPA: ParB N-terminal domain-containing protein, partial [Acholeplasmataceae bacterium]|nr:ParB N-terminal domain-containing protein [Acholeplasmataceae bacterium]
NGNIVVKYVYDAYGNILQIIGNQIIGKKNPFRYKGYYYDDETSLYYCNSRYYVPEWGRWLNADDVSYLDPSSVNGLNLYAYCGNNPVMFVDPSGCLPIWAKWVIGGVIIVGAAALTVVTAGGFAAAGTAVLSVFTATMAPTAASAVFAGAFVGSLAIGTAGMIIAGSSSEDGWSWDKAADGFMWGSIAGAVIGGTWGGTHYALQNAGKMAIKTNINNLLNNPLDDFVTIGPKDGGISSYVRSISQTGEYGNIYASKLGNGIYQIANGHHRIAALRQLGYNSVKFFLVP